MYVSPLMSDAGGVGRLTRAVLDAAADAEAQYATATLKDIKHIVEQLRLRDDSALCARA